jgi:predicted RNase H-like HicB family nuclease
MTRVARGYSVWVLELPGCISQGESKREALANIKEAIEGYLEARQIMMKKEAKGAEPIEITL